LHIAQAHIQSSAQSATAGQKRQSPKLKTEMFHGARRRKGLGDITNVTWQSQQQDDATKQKPRVHAPVSQHFAMHDPQAVPDYATEILDLMRSQEMLNAPPPDYTRSQPDINSRMRSILVEWLVEVHSKYVLRTETLFLSVALTDHYLARRPVSRGELQLVGVAGLFVASKFEEIHPPQIHDFVYITDRACSKDQICQMECNLLNAVDFHVALPTVAHFLQQLVSVSECSDTRSKLAWYLTELALLDIQMLGFAPSLIAEAALLLSGHVMGLLTAEEKRLLQLQNNAGKVDMAVVDEISETEALHIRTMAGRVVLSMAKSDIHKIGSSVQDLQQDLSDRCDISSKQVSLLLSGRELEPSEVLLPILDETVGAVELLLVLRATAPVRDCVEWLRGLASAAPTGACQAVRLKYSRPVHHCVADLLRRHVEAM